MKDLEKDKKPPLIDLKEVKVWDILDRIVEQDEELLFKTIVEYPTRKYYLYILKNDTKIYSKYFDVKPFEYYTQFINNIKEKYPQENGKNLLEIEEEYFDTVINDNDYADKMIKIGYKGKVNFSDEESLNLIKNILTINDDYALLSYGLDGFIIFYKQLKKSAEVSKRTRKEECDDIIKLIHIFLKCIGFNEGDYDYRFINFGYYVENYNL